MTADDKAQQRRSDRLFGAVVMLHGVVFLAIPVALLMFLEFRAPAGTSRGIGQALYWLMALGVILLLTGWRKFRSLPDPPEGGGGDMDGGARDSGSDSGDGGSD